MTLDVMTLISQGSDVAVYAVFYYAVKINHRANVIEIRHRTLEKRVNRASVRIMQLQNGEN